MHQPTWPPLPAYLPAYPQDPIHGQLVYVSKKGLQFVDSKPYQRLRRLKQLGCTYYVFPGAQGCKGAGGG